MSDEDKSSHPECYCCWARHTGATPERMTAWLIQEGIAKPDSVINRFQDLCPIHVKLVLDIQKELKKEKQ